MRVASTSGLINYPSTIADSNGASGQLEYRIFYGDQNTINILKKPFIILDGFDPGDKRKIVTMDCKVDCQKLFKPFDPLKYESIETLMLYNNKAKDLKTQLTALNYDVIIVNFPTYTNNLAQVIDGGADDIFSNGRTVASFLQKINSDIQANGSAEKLVLVGPSMGGQITRYALAYMEKKQQETGLAKWNHNTRIYLSMDSPHQGATIPLATQGDLYFLGELMGKDDAKSKYRDVIHSKAARQMLLTIAGPQTNFYNTEHDIYNQELITNGITGSKGYPVLNGIRKLAIANGSMSGVRNVNPSEKFYEVVALIKLRSTLTFGIRFAKKPVFRINNWFMPNKNSTSTLLQNFSQEPGEAINWNVTNNLWQGSLDAVPGGSFNAANDLKDEVYNSLKETNGFTSPYGLFPLLWTGEKLIVEQRIPNNIDISITPQSFKPTHSALDTSGFSDWYQPINKNLICTGQTPFDSYYGESTNMNHVSFTLDMVNWLLKELGDSTNPPISQAPSFPLGNAELSGLDKMCIGETSNYSFTDICKIPSGVTWSVSSNLQIISFTNTSVIVNGLYDGQGVLTANFQNEQTVTKNIWVGVPQITGFICPVDSTICSGTFCQQGLGLPAFTLTNSVVANSNGLTTAQIFDKTNWEWERVNTHIVIAVDTRGDKIYIAPNYVGQTKVRVRAKNNCGWSEWSELYFEVVTCGGGLSRLSEQDKAFIVYPNPSDDVVNIDVKEGNTILTVHSKVSGELFDIMGNSKVKINIKNNKASLNVSAFIKGVYILKIYIDGKTESHQIGVK